MLLRSALAASSALLLALPAARAQQPAAPHFPSNDSLTALLRAKVGTQGVGMVLGVLEADGTTRVVSYGSPGLQARPLGAMSTFEIGSITKVFTGILLADLVNRGVVSLDDPVQKYLPAGVTMPTRNGRQITLLDLATHRSSLTRMPTNMRPQGANPYPDYSIPEMHAFLTGHQLRRDIGSEFEYSNIAIALLGHVIERIEGKSYEDLVQERILRPLGMRTTSTMIDGPVREWLTVGHDERGMAAAYRGWETLPAMGALRSNAEDMLRFVAANARPDTTTALGRALRTSHRRRNAINDNSDIGLNWFIYNFGDRKIVAHGGATQGFRAWAGFDPDRRVGVVVLSNSPVNPSDLGMHLINPRVPLAGAAVAQRTEIDVPVSVLQQYAGDYEIRPTLSINVTLENGALFAQGTGQPKLPIFPETATHFFYRGVNAQLTFTRDSSGAVTGLVLHQGGREQPGRRRPAPGVMLASASELAAALPGRKATVPSRLLGGEQAVRVVVPTGYELSQSSRYPVLYVFDAERPAHSAATVVRSMATRMEAPEMIVVHVAAPTAAQRANFARFVTTELKPWVEREYRTAPLALVAGPDAVVRAVDAPAKLAVAGDYAMRASYAGRQQPAAPPTEPHVALHQSLRWVFDGWQLANMKDLVQQAGGTGWPQVEAHYAALSRRFGYAVVPPEGPLDDWALEIANRHRRFDDAIRVLERNRDYHPGSAVTWNHLGDAYRSMCRFAESRTHYVKALELARAMAYGNVNNYEMELGRIEQDIATNRPCTVPGAARSAVTVPEATLRAYVGEYMVSARLSITVTFADGKLHAQPTGEPARPMNPENEVTFAIEASPIRLTFTKDAAGAVTGLTIHQGPRDIPATKVR